MKKKLSLVGIIVLLLLVAVFSISNMQSVSVNFFVTDVKLPLVVLIISSILIGVVIAMLFSMSTSFKHKKQIKNLNNQVEDLKKQVAVKPENKEEE